MGSAAYAINPQYGVLCDGSETIVQYQTFGSPESQVSFVSNRTFGKVSMRAGLRTTETILNEINQKIQQLDRKFEGIKKDIVMEIRSNERDDRSENCPSIAMKSEYGLVASKHTAMISPQQNSQAVSRFAPNSINRARPTQSRFELSQISSIPHGTNVQPASSPSLSRFR